MIMWSRMQRPPKWFDPFGHEGCGCRDLHHERPEGGPGCACSTRRSVCYEPCGLWSDRLKVNLHTTSIRSTSWICRSLLPWLDTDARLACLAVLACRDPDVLLGDSMAIAIVGVRSARGPVGDRLIELLSIPADFQSQLPEGDRAQLATRRHERLGSVISDAHGIARIDCGRWAVERFLQSVADRVDSARGGHAGHRVPGIRRARGRSAGRAFRRGCRRKLLSTSGSRGWAKVP
jgi:hypothetical protein